MVLEPIGNIVRVMYTHTYMDTCFSDRVERLSNNSNSAEDPQYIHCIHRKYIHTRARIHTLATGLSSTLAIVIARKILSTYTRMHTHAYIP